MQCNQGYEIRIDWQVSMSENIICIYMQDPTENYDYLYTLHKLFTS